MELERVRAKGRSLNLFFLSGGPKDAGQPGKKEEAWRGLGRQGRERARYACMRVEEREGEKG